MQMYHTFLCCHEHAPTEFLVAPPECFGTPRTRFESVPWYCSYGLVAGLAVTQRTESVCLGRLKRAVVKLYDQKEFLCIHLANVLKCIYVCYNCPELCIMLYKSSGESYTNIRKSIKECISVLVDCAACFSRPHNIFGRVRNVEANPPVVDGTPALLG